MKGGTLNVKTCRTFFRCLRDAFKSVFRNFSLSLASVSCITITLIIIAAALLLSENVQNFTTEIERDVTIVVFLDSNVTDEERENFEVSIKKLSNVDSYTFQSKADVKHEMEKDSETHIINSVRTDNLIMNTAFSIIGLLVSSNQYIGKIQ